MPQSGCEQPIKHCRKAGATRVNDPSKNMNIAATWVQERNVAARWMRTANETLPQNGCERERKTSPNPSETRAQPKTLRIHEPGIGFVFLLWPAFLAMLSEFSFCRSFLALLSGSTFWSSFLVSLYGCSFWLSMLAVLCGSPL